MVNQFAVFGLQLISKTAMLIRFKFYASALAIFIFSSCAPLRPIEFNSMSDFTVESIASLPQVTLNLNLHNPNSFGCTMKEFKLNFLLSETQLASISIEKN